MLGTLGADLMTQRTKSAFTMIELVVVISILAILAAITMPLWPTESINLNAQAQALVADIQYTQNLSETRGIRYHLKKTSSTTYIISDASGGNVTNYTLGSAITFGILTNLPNSLIAFDGQGAPYSNIAIPGTPLTTNAAIVLNSSDGTSRTVTITHTTGQVSS